MSEVRERVSVTECEMQSAKRDVEEERRGSIGRMLGMWRVRVESPGRGVERRRVGCIYAGGVGSGCVSSGRCNFDCNRSCGCGGGNCVDIMVV